MATVVDLNRPFAEVYASGVRGKMSDHDMKLINTIRRDYLSSHQRDDADPKLLPTVGQVLAMSETELLSIRYIGLRSFHRLLEVLATAGVLVKDAVARAEITLDLSPAKLQPLQERFGLPEPPSWYSEPVWDPSLEDDEPLVILKRGSETIGRFIDSLLVEAELDDVTKAETEKRLEEVATDIIYAAQFRRRR